MILKMKDSFSFVVSNQKRNNNDSTSPQGSASKKEKK
jgi:hypothetical protein